MKWYRFTPFPNPRGASLALLSLFLPALSFAAQKDAAGTNWSNAANWSPAGVPTSTDHIVITEVGTGISGGPLAGTSLRTYRFNSVTTLEVQDIRINSLGTGDARALVPNIVGASNLTLNGGRGAGIPLIDHQSAGTFEIVRASTGTLSLTLGATGAFNVENAASVLQISAPIGETGGARGFTKTGAGTLILTGSRNGFLADTTTSTFSGNLVLDAGTLYLTANHTLSNVGDLLINGGEFALGRIPGGAAAATFNLGGGASTFVLNGGELSNAANSVTVAGTVVDLRSDATISNNVKIAADSSIRVRQGTRTMTLNGTLLGPTSGTAILTKQADGVLVINGANEATVGLNIASGTVSLTGAASRSLSSLAGTGALNLNNTALTLNQNTNTVMSGVISGAGGSLSKLGTGSLTLSGANTFGGGVTLNAGTLVIGNNSALGTGTFLINGGTLDSLADNQVQINTTIAGNFAFTGSTRLRFNTGTVTLAPGQHTITVNNTVANPLQFQGNVTGTGGLNIAGGGFVFFTGDSKTYTGATVINNGTLRISAPAQTSWQSASLTVNTGGVLELQSNGPYTFGGFPVILNGGTLSRIDSDPVLNAPVQLTANSTVSVGASTLTLAGPVSGAGGFTKIGAGTLQITGATTFTGPTNVGAGRLFLTGGGNLAGTSGITVADGAQLRFQDTNQLGSGSISLSGIGDGSNGALRLQSGSQSLSNAIILNTAATGIHTEGGGSQLTITGPLSGPGGLQKTGGGTLILNGPVSYTGATNVNAGTLQLNSVGSLASTSSVNLAATLQLNVPGATTWQLGTGNIVMLGGTLRQLSGTENDIATINQNIVLQNAAQTSTLNAPGDSRIYVAGDISGPGNLNKAGGGELRFIGQNKTYTGSTTVSNGRLRIDSDGIPTGTPAINLAGGNLRFGQGGTRTYSLGAGGSVPITFTAAGSSIEKTDTGSTTLTNPITVNAAGNIRNREAGSTFTLTGPLTGAGDLTFNVGTGGNPTQLGTIALTGNAAAFAGNVTLQQGTLRLGPNTVLGANNFTQNAGSTLGITIQSPTQFGRINATGAATFNGPATIQPTFTGGLTQGVNNLDIVTAAGGITVNQPLTVSSGSPLLVLSLNQTPNILQLILNVDYTGAASGLSLNRNQTAVAQFVGSGSGNPAFDLLQAGALNQQGADAIRNFYDSVGAEELGALSDMAFTSAQGQLRNVQRRTQGLQPRPSGPFMIGANVRRDPEVGSGDDLLARSGGERAAAIARRQIEPRKQWSIFADLNFQRQAQDRTFDIGGYETASQGFTVGADRFLTDQWVLGAYAGYDRARTQFDLQRGWTTADSATVGGYLGWINDNWHLTGALQYNRHEYEMERYSLLGTARGQTSGNQLSTMLSGGYDIKHGRWTLGPTGSLSYSKLWIDGFSENGSPIAQSFSSQEADSLQLGVGGKLSYLFPGNFVSLRPEIRAEYRREFMDNSRFIDSTLIGGGPVLQLETSPPSKDFAVLGGSLNAVFSDSTTAFVNYEAEVGRSDYIAHAVYGGVRWNFPGGPVREPMILFEDEPKDWRDAFWQTPVGQALRWINLRGTLHAQYDYIETNSKAGTIDPRDPDMENVLFFRRLRLEAERDLGAGFYIDGAGEYDEHAQNRPPLRLFSANAGWRPIEEFHLMFGFDKVPLSHEENISSARLKTVERSVASRTFTKLGDLGEQHVRLAAEGRFRNVLDGDFGILHRYDIHYEAAIAHPSEDASALWDDDPEGTRSSMPAPSYYFRLTHEFQTDWGDLHLGTDLAYAPSFRARGSNQPSGAQAISPYLVYNKGWFNLMAQWMALTYLRDDANGNIRRSPTGFTIQPSFFLHPKWEIVAMYSTFDTNGDQAIRFNQSVRNAPTFYPDDRRFDDIHQFYLGFNHYIKGNDIKLSTGIERIEADGARANRPVSAEDAWAVRARLQILF